VRSQGQPAPFTVSPSSIVDSQPRSSEDLTTVPEIDTSRGKGGGPFAGVEFDVHVYLYLQIFAPSIVALLESRVESIYHRKGLPPTAPTAAMRTGLPKPICAETPTVPREGEPIEFLENEGGMHPVG
jgi:hypothetical protein